MSPKQSPQRMNHRGGYENYDITAPEIPTPPVAPDPMRGATGRVHPEITPPRVSPPQQSTPFSPYTPGDSLPSPTPTPAPIPAPALAPTPAPAPVTRCPSGTF